MDPEYLIVAINCRILYELIRLTHVSAHRREEVGVDEREEKKAGGLRKEDDAGGPHRSNLMGPPPI